MKKCLTIAFALAIGLIIPAVVACKPGAASPSKVTKNFHAALVKGDAQAYSELLTPDAQPLIAPLAEKSKDRYAKKGSITAAKETIEGDGASVELTYKDGSVETVQLAKIEGQWKIDMLDGFSPSKVVRDFHAALLQGDTKACSEMMVQDSQAMMAMFAEKAKGHAQKQGAIMETKDTIQGFTARVDVTYSNGSKEKIDLLNVDGEWKITIKK